MKEVSPTLYLTDTTEGSYEVWRGIGDTPEIIDLRMKKLRSQRLSGSVTDAVGSEFPIRTTARIETVEIVNELHAEALRREGWSVPQAGPIATRQVGLLYREDRDARSREFMCRGCLFLCPLETETFPELCVDCRDAGIR